MKKLLLGAALLASLFTQTRAQSLDFDGVDDYVSITNTTYPGGNFAYTLEAWINPRTMGAKGIIGWGNYGTTDEVMALRLDNTGIYNYWWGDDLYGNTGDITGAWHHVAVTFDGTTRTMYVDGVAISSDSPNGTLNVTDLTNITIGRTWTAEYFDGQIDEVRVWNTARTANEIVDNMYCSINGGTNLVASYDFNSGVPNGSNPGVNTLMDIAGNGNDGTLNNFNLAGTGSNWVANAPMPGFTPSANIAASATIVPPGTTVTFTATATNAGTTPSYQWLKNNVPVGTNSNTYSDNTLVDKDTITCQVTSSRSCSSPATVNTNKVGMTVASFNAALNFDGSDDYVMIGNILPASYTKEAWITINNSSLANNIISGGLDGQHAFWAPSGILQSGHNSAWSTVTDNTPLTPGQWYHVAVSYDATAQVMKLYKNGVLISSATGVGGYNGGNAVRLGAYDNATNPFGGTMDEVRIWNTVRTDAEIMDNMNCTIATATGLVASYNFNDGIANANNAGFSTLHDNSGNANDGTLNNFLLIGTTSNWVGDASIQATPAVTVAGSATAICSGTSVSFTATPVSGGFTPSYQWTKNGSNVGTNSNTYTDNTLSSSDVIAVNLTSSIACATSPVTSNTLSVNVTATPTVTINGTTTICSGTSTTFTVSGASTFTWSSNAGSATTNTVSLNTAGTYTVTGDNGNGCTTDQTVTLTVNATPTVTINGATAVCAGSSTTFTASGATTYTWSSNAGSAASSTVSVNAADTYTVTGEDNGCTADQTITLAINPTPTVTINGTAAICAGDSSLLTAGGTATSFTWSANAGSVTTTTVSVKNAGVYSVNGSDGTCDASQSFTLTVNALPTVLFDVNPNTFCLTDPAVTLTATPANGSFSGNGVSAGQFDPSAAGGAGTYTLTYVYTDGNNCTNNDTAVVTILTCSSGLSQALTHAVQIYPNPASDVLYIQAAGLENAVLELYNHLGQKVSVVQLNTTVTSVSIANLAGGLYTARVISNKSLISQVKIVKQ